jgi:2-polyprenyl-6-methoxyphenol hydroxylase-like FAD-dependent oxidoreductase
VVVLSIAVPSVRTPFVYDVALAAMTLSKIWAAQRRRDPALPCVIGLDVDGNATGCSEQVAFPMPMAGERGLGLTLAVQLVAGAMLGFEEIAAPEQYAFQAGSVYWADRNRCRPHHTHLAAWVADPGHTATPARCCRSVRGNSRQQIPHTHLNHSRFEVCLLLENCADPCVWMSVPVNSYPIVIEDECRFAMADAEMGWVWSMLDELSSGTFPYVFVWQCGTKPVNSQPNSSNSRDWITTTVRKAMPAAQTALVIGGGIAGPVVAAALAMAGIESDIYERHPAGSEGIGGSLALQPNGLAALRIIDADDAVRAAATPITRSVMSIANRPGREFPSLPGSPRQLIRRGTLHRLLHARARCLGIRIHHGKRLIGVDERADRVTAWFADGTHADADILIGADGVRSPVRRIIDPAAPSAGYTGLLGFEGLVDASRDTIDIASGTMTFAFGARAYYLFWKRPDGRVGWGANLPSTQYLGLKQARGISASEWLSTLRDAYAGDTPGASLAATTTPEELQVVGALHIMPPVPHWYRDRLVLVGDSVHAPSYSNGQGASLAFESGVQLARCLRDLPDVPAAFATYEQLRRSRVEKIAARGAKINQAKAPGSLVQKVMPLRMRVMFSLLNVEKSMGVEQRYVIDWDKPVQQEAVASA